MRACGGRCGPGALASASGELEAARGLGGGVRDPQRVQESPPSLAAPSYGRKVWIINNIYNMTMRGALILYSHLCALSIKNFGYF